MCQLPITFVLWLQFNINSRVLIFFRQRSRTSASFLFPQSSPFFSLAGRRDYLSVVRWFVLPPPWPSCLQNTLSAPKKCVRCDKTRRVLYLIRTAAAAAASKVTSCVMASSGSQTLLARRRRKRPHCYGKKAAILSFYDHRYYCAMSPATKFSIV